MDWKKTFSQVKYDLERNHTKYQNADSVEERQDYINNYIKTLNYIQKILNGQVPSFYRDPFHNLYYMSKDQLKKMEEGINNFPKKVMVDQGGGKPSNNKGNDDDDKMNQGLADTIMSEKPNVRWDDVAGLVEAKRSLNEALILPLKMPNFFVGNVKPWKGILLYGPPGTGKTFIAKACATECQSTFFNVSSSDLISKYVGESEKQIKQLFKLANEKAPSIIFIDEIDSMCGSRSDGENESSRRVKTEFLVQMQGVGNQNDKVLVLGATNLPWALDSAIRRRFERRIYIPLPDRDARSYLIKNKLKGLDSKLTEDAFRQIAEKSEGYSGSDLEIVCKEAAMEPLRFAQQTNSFKKVNINGQTKYLPLPKGQQGDFNGSVYQLPANSLALPDLQTKDLIQALKHSKPSVSKNDLKQYLDWTKEFGIE